MNIKDLFKLSDQTYDILKWIVILFLPALTTFAGVVLTVINFQHTDAVLTVMVALNTFLGAVLGISNNQYKKENKD